MIGGICDANFGPIKNILSRINRFGRYNVHDDNWLFIFHKGLSDFIVIDRCLSFQSFESISL